MAKLSNQFELHANQMLECKKQLLAHAADAFEGGNKPVKVVDLLPLQAKIEQLTLKNDFLESELTKAASLSAKLSNRPRSQTAWYPTGQTAQSQPRLGALPAQVGECCRSGTLARRMGIEALAPQPGTSKAAPGNKTYPNLLRKLAIVRANRVIDGINQILARAAISDLAVLVASFIPTCWVTYVVTREGIRNRIRDSGLLGALRDFPNIRAE